MAARQRPGRDGGRRPPDRQCRRRAGDERHDARPCPQILGADRRAAERGPVPADRPGGDRDLARSQAARRRRSPRSRWCCVARALSVGAPLLAMRPFVSMGGLALPTLVWGGLRGGISIALALSLPEGPARTVILAVTYIIVLFSVIVQGGTIDRLVDRLKARPRRSRKADQPDRTDQRRGRKRHRSRDQAKVHDPRGNDDMSARAARSTAAARRSASRITRIAIARNTVAMARGSQDGSIFPNRTWKARPMPTAARLGPHPAGEGPLVGEDRSILGEVGPARRASVRHASSVSSGREASGSPRRRPRRSCGRRRRRSGNARASRHGARIRRRTAGRRARRY